MKLNYFCHFINSTLSNERCVEVALAKEFIKKFPVFTEVGAVLPYYGNRGKKVIDCFDELGDDDRRFSECDIRGENIVSISTIEHFGNAEYNNEKINNLEGLAGLLQIITQSENYFITIPLGFNSILDKQVESILSELNCYGFRRDVNTPWQWEMVYPITESHFREDNLYNKEGFTKNNNYFYGANFILIITSEKIEENISFLPYGRTNLDAKNGSVTYY